MLSAPIFSRDSSGRTRSWRYEVEGAQWRTISGLVNGEKVTTGWTTCVPKSQDTAEEQALFEAQAEEKKKLDRKYFASIADVAGERASGYRPMLANKYEGWVGPCFSQPKLDGIRNLAARPALWSRTGKKIVSCPHISAALAEFFAAFPEGVLDGELYNHDLRDDFNTITSVVKKTKPTSDDIAEAARVIEYHVYDIASHEGGFQERTDFLWHHLANAPDCIKLVPTSRHLNPDSLDAKYAEYLVSGYEGQMVRFNGAYQQKRSWELRKRKEFIDEEFPFLGLQEGEGNWAGIPKTVGVGLPNSITCYPSIKGSQEFCRSLVGKQFDSVTVRYQGWTPDGSLRFPVAVAFHEGERL